MASTIEKYDEMMDGHPDRRSLQEIPGEHRRYGRGGDDGPPNWQFYRDPRDMGAPLQLEDHSGLDFQVIVKAMWYYRGLFMTIALLLATLFVAANHILMPDKYEATARVRVKMPAIIDDSPRARQVVSVIPTEVLSDRVLTRVIEDLDMTKHQTPEIVPQILSHFGIEAKTSVEDGTGIMRYLREMIKIHQERQGMQTAVFTVSLTSKKPEFAAEVVNAVVTAYMDQRHTFESSDASEAVAFLAPQVQAAEEALQAENEKLAAYKVKNAAFLVPSQMIEETLLRLEDEYQAAEKRIAQLEEVNRGLKQLRAGEPQFIQSSALAADAPSSAASELAALQNRLARAQARYVEGHVYLVQLKAEIAALEKAAARTPTRQVRRGSGQVTNPDWLAMSQDINANSAEARVLNDRLPVIERQIDRLTQHLGHTTSAQATLITLQGSWDQAYTRYNSINGQYLAAQTRAQAQGSDVGKELSILDEARVPTLPITASRTTLQLLGVVGGFAIAFALVLIYTRYKNWEIPKGGKPVNILTAVFLNLLGIAWLTALIGYIVLTPYI